MLTESFIAAVEGVNKPSAHLSSALKDVGIFQYEFQPQNIFRHGYKKTSTKPSCLAITESHIFAAQAGKAVIHVYNRAKGNQEATVPFPDKIHSLVYAQDAAILIIGTEDGKLMLWEIASGRISTSAASHLESVGSLTVTSNNDYIISGSADSSIHVWSLGQLVSFSLPSQPYSNETPRDAPIRTFSNHRAAITAVAVGHSGTNTNFAVSTDSDRTCYLWHVETCQVLRTFLMPSISLSITLDPADRAIYFGNNDGTIQSIDLFEQSQTSRTSIYNATDAAPTQILAEDRWGASASEIGAANCITLSYDGTTLLSGHTGGSIMRWDVAKHRHISEVANLHQPVSSIEMLVPDGLRREQPHYTIPAIVKPRLELNAESTDNTIGMPASYSFTAQVVRPAPTPSDSNAVSDVLAGNPFPDSLLDDAIQAMAAKAAGPTDSTTTTTKDSAATSKNDKYKIQALEEEKAILEKKLVVMQKLHDAAQERHLKRQERRAEIGLQRREAYFAAKKKGKDGDAAMKPFEKLIEAVNVESDEEELAAGEQMQVDQ